MSAFNMFRAEGGATKVDSGNAAGGNPQQNQQAGPGGVQLDGRPAPTRGNPGDPNSQNLNPDGGENAAPKAPLEQFSKLWEDPPSEKNADGTPKQKRGTNNPMFNVDPKKIMDAANSVDFTSVITPEIRRKIEAGGAEGTEAMMGSLRSLASTLYAQNTMGTAKMIDAALARQAQQFQEMLPGIIKKHSLGESLGSSNPLFNNPATKPIFRMVQERIAEMHPEMSVQEQKEMAEEYFTNFASALTPEERGKDSKGNPIQTETDWSSYLPDPLRSV
jgi:hypothetical protein